MESIDLQSMSLDELWALHETICLILARKLEAEKRSHEQRLNELRRKFGKASNETPERRPYPKVHPKFRNPKPPHQTWSGRDHPRVPIPVIFFRIENSTPTRQNGRP